MLQNFIEILILSAVQGISEFLPISSSAHLILISNFYAFSSSSLFIDIGHYESENHIKLIIKEFLNKKLPNFTLLLSEDNVNPVKYY